jgi:hypothetical protein
MKDNSELRKSDYPAQTYTDKAGLAEIYGPTYTYAPITLTAGLEKLGGKHASSTESGDSVEETGTAAQSTSSSTGTSTDSAEAPGESNDGVRRSVPSILALACVGLFILAF